MHEQIEALRRRIDEIGRASDGRRSFTAAIRKEAITLAEQWKKSGRNLSALADALSLHKTTLRAWVDGLTPKRVRAVRVTSDVVERPVKRQSASTLVAVLPSGIRIEGLELADVLELAGALR